MKIVNSDKSTELSDEALALLLSQVDSRLSPPEDVERAVYEQTRGDWLALQARHAKKLRKVRTYRFLAVAAVILLAIMIKPAFFPAGTATDGLAMLGVVNNQVGTAFVVRGNQRRPLSVGSAANDVPDNQLFSGDSIITTAGSGVSINWAAGSIIRLAASSELTLHGAAELELKSGQIYADIPTLPSDQSAALNLKINTRFGTVQHIGTQFMVSDHPDAVVVMVREGSVSVTNEQQTLVTTAGHQSTLDSGGEINRSAVPVFGDEWQWAEQLAPAFNVEGQPLHEVLQRIGREAGKQILYESADAEQIAKSTVMHGSIDAAPEYALENLLETNDLSWYEENGAVHLFVRQ